MLSVAVFLGRFLGASCLPLLRVLGVDFPLIPSCMQKGTTLQHSDDQIGYVGVESNCY